MTKQLFNPTVEETEKMRQLFASYGEVYNNLVAYFPKFGEVVQSLPGEMSAKGQKEMQFKIDRILMELRPVLADALCRVRGLPDGSINL